MLNLETENKPDLRTVSDNNSASVTLDEIEKFYYPKNKKEFLFGLEYERLSLDKNTLENASYEKMSAIISHFAKILDWDLLYDKENIIGATSNDFSSISLEPGCQMEISLSPKKDILEIDLELTKIISVLDEIASFYDVIFLGYGLTPKSAVDDIKIIPKRRYRIMNEYLPYCKDSELCTKMMRQSAGIQVNVDYKDGVDAYLKLKFLNIIMPFMCALCANSPFENNALSSNKTNRANVWRYTGSSRCNMFYQNIFKNSFLDFNKEKNVFKNYIDEILNVPMVYSERDDKIIPIKGKLNFREFMKEGFLSFKPQMKDYILHQSLCFPDVRLKNYIEIRNHDSSNPQMALALCAFYKGLLNCNIKKLIREFNFLKLSDIEKYNKLLISFGLDFKVNKSFDGWGVAAKLFNIAKNKLNAKDRSYLTPILNILKTRKTSADIIIDYNIKTAFDLVEFLK